MSRTESPAPDGAILIVTGSDLRAEQMDRPLAYYVQERINEQLAPYKRPVIVMSDCRYLYEAGFEDFPTLSIGGPGVNAVAHEWLKEVPFIFAADEEFYIQMNEAGDESARASVWGVDHDSTKIAIATFIENYVDEFLLLCDARVHWTT